MEPKSIKNNRYVQILHDRFTDYDQNHTPYGFEIIIQSDTDGNTSYRKTVSIQETTAANFLKLVEKAASTTPEPDGLILIHYNTYKEGEAAEIDRKEIRLSEKKKKAPSAAAKAKQSLAGFDPDEYKEQIKREVRQDNELNALRTSIMVKDNKIAELTKELDAANKQLDEYADKDYELLEKEHDAKKLKTWATLGAAFASKIPNNFLQQVGAGILAGMNSLEDGEQAPPPAQQAPAGLDEYEQGLISWLRSMPTDMNEKVSILLREISLNGEKINDCLEIIGIIDIQAYKNQNGM